MKIVINKCYGGYGLSEAAVMEYAKRKGITLYADSGRLCTSYYTIPVDEYAKLYDEYLKTGDGDKINEVYFTDRDIERNDPILISVIEEIGCEASSDRYAELAIIEIPDGIEWEIDDYDGFERIAEKHRVWN
jgi:hypothetical protein